MNTAFSFSYGALLCKISREPDSAKRQSRLQGLAKLLVARSHARYLPEIRRAYQAISQHNGNHAKVSIQSAKPLSESDTTTLQQTLEKKFNAAFQFSFIVNPSLIGGLRIVINDQLYDFSYASQLHQLQQRLTKSL